MNSQKRFTIGGFHAPYSLGEIQDTPEVIAAIDRLNIGESWDDGNGSETVTRIADACEVHALTVEQLQLVIRALGIAERQLSRLHRDAIDNTINVHGARDIDDKLKQVHHFHDDACKMVDLIAYLKTVSNG